MRCALIAGGWLWFAAGAFAESIHIELQPVTPQQQIRAVVTVVGEGGFALGGKVPRGWWFPSTGDECNSKSRQLLTQEAVEVGANFLLVLHDDAMLSAVTPERNLAGGNIAWITPLNEMPLDWIVDEVGRIHVLLGKQKTYQVLSVETGRVLASYAMNAFDRNAVLSRFGGVWFAADGGRGLEYLDERDVISLHSANSPIQLLVPSTYRHEVLVIREETIARFSEAQLLGSEGIDFAIRAAVTSRLSDAVYLLEESGEAIRVLDVLSLKTRNRIELRGVADTLYTSPDGRWIFAMDPRSGVIWVVDSAFNIVQRILQVHSGIGAVAFSDGYLYMQELRRPYVVLLQLSSLLTDKERMLEVGMGGSVERGALAQMAGNSMAVLNAGDSQVYLYMESGMSDGHGLARSPAEMLAPYAAVPIKGGRAVELKVGRAGWTAGGAGRFETLFSAPHPGDWRLAVGLVGSRDVVCKDVRL